VQQLRQMTKPIIISCSPYFEGWQKMTPTLTGDKAQWIFYEDRPRFFWERTIRRPNLAMLRACFQTVIRAARGDIRLLITHDRATLYCAALCRLLGIRVDHYVHSFNFPELPVGLRLRLTRFASTQIARFSVHSTLERRLYSRYFGIPEDRIRVRLWSIDVPKVSPAHPLQEGRYVSAIGGNGRDYPTLLEACRMLPHIAFVLVLRPENLAGLEVPPNVRLIVNAPFEEAMNILQHSAFTVLPLPTSTTPCGHVTLVCAMHLGKTVVATASEGIADYVFHGRNGLTCAPSSPRSLADAIDRLWADPAETVLLSDNNRRFGAEYCSEARGRNDLASVLTEWRIGLSAEVFPAYDFTSGKRSP
jgi:glycosyltransferase involved in cell wall biosynthesis